MLRRCKDVGLADQSPCKTQKQGPKKQTDPGNFQVLMFQSNKNSYRYDPQIHKLDEIPNGYPRVHGTEYCECADMVLWV